MAANTISIGQNYPYKMFDGSNYVEWDDSLRDGLAFSRLTNLLDVLKNGIPEVQEEEKEGPAYVEKLKEIGRAHV